MKDINIMFSELAQYTRIVEEHNTEVLTGTEHKASYKAVTSSRLDGAALKKDLPDIAAQYTKATETKRFLFQ